MDKDSHKESADLGSFVITGWSVKRLLVSLEIVPEGWAAIIAIGAVAAVGSHYFYFDKKYINPLINEHF